MEVATANARAQNSSPPKLPDPSTIIYAEALIADMQKDGMEHSAKTVRRLLDFVEAARAYLDAAE